MVDVGKKYCLSLDCNGDIFVLKKYMFKMKKYGEYLDFFVIDCGWEWVYLICFVGMMW